MFLLAFSFANFENWGVTFLGSVVNFYHKVDVQEWDIHLQILKIEE